MVTKVVFHQKEVLSPDYLPEHLPHRIYLELGKVSITYWYTPDMPSQISEEILEKDRKIREIRREIEELRQKYDMDFSKFFGFVESNIGELLKRGFDLGEVLEDFFDLGRFT